MYFARGRIGNGAVLPPVAWMWRGISRRKMSTLNGKIKTSAGTIHEMKMPQ
jgi:hypothetical protein